jgi:DNA-binding SARP family transcriptional activator
VPVALPQSKKARALLGYLVLTRRAHRRERLTGLFWDVADDARGALRWTLSRVRAAIDEAEGSCIVADRDEVRFEAAGASVDCFALPALLAGGVAQAPLEALERAASLFRGELLEGSDLPDFFEFSAWLSAERAEARRTHTSVLAALSERLVDPERALPYARARVQIDPLDEAASVTLVRLLLGADRRAEAEEHCESIARLLDDVGQPRGRLLATLRSELRVRTDAPPSTRQGPARLRVPDANLLGDVGFVGRSAELDAIARARSDALTARRPRVVLVAGDPGIGKSRVVGEAVRRLRAQGGVVRQASAFEADRGLPFLPWTELLRAADLRGLDEADEREVSRLLPGRAEPAPPESSRETLFRAVARTLEAADVVVFDDAQWLDDASTALLHHALRVLKDRPFVCVLAARRGELSENQALVGLLRGARRDRLLVEVELGPLPAAEVLELVRAAKPVLEPERIVRESAGSPLVALELARFTPGPGSDVPGTFSELVADRLERLPRPSLELVKWAATLGGHFEGTLLGALSGQPSDELVRQLELLERHAFLRAASDTSEYAFAHELLERAIYLGISEPRRRLMHRRIAELLAARGADAPANDVSRHAALGGDSALAATACLRAAERCLRVFANDEARTFALRGLRHAAVLEEARRVPLEIDLRCVAIQARRPSDPEEVVTLLLSLGERALDLGHTRAARAAYHLISLLRWEVGRFTDAERASAFLENVGRGGELADRARAMAEAGHCLALLERDMPKAEALLLEARALAQKGAFEVWGLSIGLGVLCRYRGETAEAARLFTAARGQSRGEGNRGAEFDAFTHLVELSYQAGELERAEREAVELMQLGERLQAGSEPAFSRGLLAVVRYAKGELGAVTELDAACGELRQRDATHRLATLLLYAAEIELGRDAASSALTRAREAEALAKNLERRNDLVVARALGALAESKLGAPDRLRALRELSELPPAGLSARAQEFLARALELVAPAEPWKKVESA